MIELDKQLFGSSIVTREGVLGTRGKGKKASIKGEVRRKNYNKIGGGNCEKEHGVALIRRGHYTGGRQGVVSS